MEEFETNALEGNFPRARENRKSLDKAAVIKRRLHNLGAGETRRRPVESRFLGQLPFPRPTIAHLSRQDQERLPGIANIPTTTTVRDFVASEDDDREYAYVVSEQSLNQYGEILISDLRERCRKI